MIMSSILKIVMAASVANLIELILEIMGYRIPSFKLFLGFPFSKSNPQCFHVAASGFLAITSGLFDAMWIALSLETSSVASWAAFTAKVLGMMFKASLNSAMAICSLVSKSVENYSRWMLLAI